jgi:hypothetical protein
MPFADETLGGKLCEPPAAPLMVPPVGAGVAAGAPDRAVLSNSAIWAEHGPASDGTTLKARRPPALASSAYALIGSSKCSCEQGGNPSGHGVVPAKGRNLAGAADRCAMRARI